MACIHVDSPQLRKPRPNESVYREDCTQCFDSIDSPSGLDVCLFCFNGGCPDSLHNHSLLHVSATSHPLVLNIKRTRKQTAREEPPQKITKLAIARESEADRYDTVTRVKCYECGVDEVEQSPKLKEVVQGVLKANTFADAAEVKAWELELTACEHTLCLEQEPARQIESQTLGHCYKCELNNNLWLCLTCGNLGCGRAQYGGVGGNGHGVEHTRETLHPVAVKLGSLTADGTADIYCYACDEERVDPELPTHLANWGIDIKDRQKTEKSLVEMQLEHNLQYDFGATSDGKEQAPLFGEGFTGLKNLGNSCYMNSILQSLFSFPEFKSRYLFSEDTSPPPTAKPAGDLETQLRKMADGLLSGRYATPDSDVFPPPASGETQAPQPQPHQKGLAPAMLKHLVGRGHEEFSTMRQQDAFEFLLHILKLITRSQHAAPLQDPVEAFRFVMEQRLQCLNCKKVRYKLDEQENISVPVPIRRIPRSEAEEEVEMADAGSGATYAPIKDLDDSNEKKAAQKEKEKEREEFEPVTLQECLDIFTADEHVELTCSSCASKAGFTKSSKFRTFPQILAVNARRFELVNWVPTKQDVPVLVDDAPVNFAAYKSSGLQEGEEELLEDADTATALSNKFVPNEAALSMLEAMGFPRVRCEKALHATGNSDAEAASNWLFAHMEDPDIDTPLDLGGAASAGQQPSAEQIEMLAGMGFNAPQARQALKETGGDVERAVEWLFSHPDAEGDFSSSSPDTTQAPKEKKMPGTEAPAKFGLQSIVCHKGSSIHAGHYVAFVRKVVPGETEASWVLFNDEKVVKAVDIEEMKKFAYVYFFRRV